MTPTVLHMCGFKCMMSRNVPCFYLRLSSFFVMEYLFLFKFQYFHNDKKSFFIGTSVSKLLHEPLNYPPEHFCLYRGVEVKGGKIKLGLSFDLSEV